MTTLSCSLSFAALTWLCALGIHPAAEPDARAQESAPDAPRAVLVTGASSGIGRKTAELLAASGFHVYAGARKQADLDALDELDNVTAIRLDVTVPAEIEAAVETVRQAGRGLYGLINNAGVVVVGPLIELPEEDLQFQMDVNVFGPYRVTRAFAPMLIESRGRISTTGSISGILTWSMGGPYTMSKHAMEAYSDTLAAELEGFGVRVSIVDPGNYRSDIMASMHDRMLAGGFTSEGSRYKDRLDGFMSSPMDREQYKEPDEVAEAFLHALSDDDPKRRYMVVPNERGARVTIQSALRRVAELNHGQPYTYSREQLIEMLDEALAAAD